MSFLTDGGDMELKNMDENMTEDTGAFSAISKLTEREQLEFFSYVRESMAELLSENDIDKSLDPQEQLYALMRLIDKSLDPQEQLYVLMRLGVIPCPPMLRPIAFAEFSEFSDVCEPIDPSSRKGEEQNFGMKNEEKNNVGDTTDPVTGGINTLEDVLRFLRFLKSEKISDQYNTDFAVKYVEQRIHEEKLKKTHEQSLKNTEMSTHSKNK